jgi:hypothetical protein
MSLLVAAGLTGCALDTEGLGTAASNAAGAGGTVAQGGTGGTAGFDASAGQGGAGGSAGGVAGGGAGGSAGSTPADAHQEEAAPPPSCSDGAKNGTESDIDCGGACLPCANGKVCGTKTDCLSGVCASNTCAAATCSDQVTNGTETDVDCGGGACPKCGFGKGCTQGTDCAGGECAGGFCAATCTDGVINGTETDLDCGGSCPLCADGKSCKQGGDCASLVCKTGTCQVPTCTDLVKNGKETDIDCGATCPGCATGKSCGIGADCASLVCKTGSCAAPTCADGVRNQAETDVDCGASPCPACGVGKNCVVGSNCATDVCSAGICVEPFSCKDLLAKSPGSPSGVYTLRPPGAATTALAYCEMTAQGGGWTQFLQCLPADDCKVAGQTLVNLDWLAFDAGSVQAGTSYLAGKSLAGLLAKDGSFMVVVTEVATARTGRIVYPLDANTRKYFSGSAQYASAPLQARVIDWDGTASQVQLRICYAPTSMYRTRSLAGVAGLVFLGNTSGDSGGAPTSSCNYGGWNNQMYMPDPALYSISTSFGMTPGVASWSASPYAHRVFVREL